MDMIQLFNNFSGAYLFSACLQANASILAIFGVFWVFRIQAINSNIDSIKFALSTERGISTDIGNLDPAVISIFEPKSFEERKRYIENEVDNPSAKALLEDWIKKDAIKSKIIGSIKLPTLIIGCALIVDSICLTWANLIHQYNGCFELSLMTLVLVIQIVTMCVVIYNIIATTNNKEKVT